MVKLNDPLMGTETFHYRYDPMPWVFYHVKLNDPLMGTETPGYLLVSYSILAFSC